MPHIYAVTNVPPEVLAYGMAKYSRSNRSLADNLKDLTEDKAAKFLKTFYFDYGHASIADLAHVAIAIEDISLLAAMEIVDEPLWDGQERSTRYQNFDSSDYYRPETAPSSYDTATHKLWALYHQMQELGTSLLTEQYPRPSDMPEKTYARIIHARALDIARYCLPLNTLTSLGQITSARVLEQQIRRLFASPFPEVHNIARELKKSIADQPAVDLMYQTNQPVLPTLVKYTEADAYLMAVRTIIEPLAKQVPSLPAQAVELTIQAPLLDAQIAQLLYAFGQASYRSCLQFASTLTTAEKQELISQVFSVRGPHDEWLRLLRQAPLQFDLIMDTGAYRDFNRHRRTHKIAQSLNPDLKFSIPAPLTEAGLDYEFIATLSAYYDELSAYSDTSSLPYLLPLAHKRRLLMSMDLAEAAYIIELRSRSQGHFSYRQLAWDMYEALRQQLPDFARYIRVTPPGEFNPFQR
ncbi:FAD-dependent thymidylate synthase [Sulfobacillus thermosulfidooxidans]|uniref:FAD-dependent thymidylate synthase n=1 Tax=Sulfobacillus thermosulfidooxidans TaxID=28034 RepID=UPI0002EEB29B|nr:FAD-dependent thymidylate synthase [Sulfobacillus thermosulfidooxidans]